MLNHFPTTLFKRKLYKHLSIFYLKRGVFMGDDDYELMPIKEVEQLRREISAIKKNPYGESDRGRDLQESIERLNSTLNKFISILEDAQQDIIDEYQESKPTEKLNQILDQNETIAKAIVSLHESVTSNKPMQPTTETEQPKFPSFSQQQFQPMNQQVPQNTQMMGPMQPMGPAVMSQPQVMGPMQPMGPTQTGQSSYTQMSMSRPANQFQRQSQIIDQPMDLPPLPPMSEMDDLPPLEGVDSQGMPDPRKKKFLGMI